MPINLNRVLDQITTPVSFGKPNTRQVKKYFKIFINFNYIAGFIYAFYFFITTSRVENMFERRLWAFECWLILSLYGLFIYLFYLEKSALEEQRGLYRFMHIQALKVIEAPMDKVINWFNSLADEPEQYQFNSHQGVKLLKGSLTQKGSIFETKERFLGVMIGLKFRVSKVTDNQFEFKLIEPKWLKNIGVQGRFEVQPLVEERSRLELVVFNSSKTFFGRIFAALFLYLSPVRLAISKQIRKEVRFIKRQVERK
jgi:hypothetical protein